MSVEVLTSFIRENLLPDDWTGEFDERTPLLERGILDSLKTAMLLNFVRDAMGVTVPTAKIEPANFRTVLSFAEMLRALGAPSRPVTG